MIKQLFNLVIAKYRDMSVFHKSSASENNLRFIVTEKSKLTKKALPV